MDSPLAAITNDGTTEPRPGLSLAWLVLVNPKQAWLSLAAQQCALPAWAPPVFAQWVMLGLAQVIALQAVFELTQHAGLTTAQLPPGALALVWQLLLYALGVALCNALVACVIFLLAKLVSIRASFQQSFILTAYALLPAVLGHALGMSVLAIAQPLTRQPAHALAVLIRPFSCGLASFSHLAGEPLSLGWLFASYFDIFGLWSLALLVAGTVLYLRAQRTQAAWLALGVMLSFSLGLTGWWRLLQMIATR
jgi:hypothetical protein